ncbi:LAMI_0H16314g1_1 [Lachancea mirantina]|uniref:Midasin n=1 Tax=Lachancea mirantina TaxID=1230905 RepID=A0A1G4KIT0_9SACH|nr:LAMI_0H16314g1_1 [Lachancea mirantina]
MLENNNISLDLDVCRHRFESFNKFFEPHKLHTFHEIDLKANVADSLCFLAEQILKSSSTTAYLWIYQPILLDIVARWASRRERQYYSSVISAIGEIVALFPQTTGLVEFFLEHASGDLNELLQERKIGDDVHRTLLAFYRLLSWDRTRFVAYVRPEVFYQVLRSAASSQIEKLLCCKILGMHMNMTEKAQIAMQKSFGCHAIAMRGVYGNDLGVDYQFLELNEAKRIAKYSQLFSEPEGDNHFKGTSRNVLLIYPSALSDLVVSVYGVLLPLTAESSRRNDIRDPLTLVPTTDALDVIRKLALTMQRSKPVMLVGAAGSGKTFLVDQLSKAMGQTSQMVKIHLGEQTDVKLLLGTYTSGEKPGTFEWKYGVLTTAVREGRWVLIEDIDRAPTEVLSILLTLLEKHEISIHSRGETIRAANGFQLISTIRTPEKQVSEDHHEILDSSLVGYRLWEKIHLPEMGDQNLELILKTRFKSISSLVPKLILAFNSVRSILTSPQFISLNRGVQPRTITVRDLVKLCSRIEVLIANSGIRSSSDLMESATYDSIFAEATDCFASAIGEFGALTPIVEAIGSTLEIPPSRTALFLTRHVPNFIDSVNNVTIGRSILPKSSSNIRKKSVNVTSFAQTNHSLRLMEQVGVAVQMIEPVLLVGETGTGKTTVVQEMAKSVNQKLTVLNLSQQTESGDLLGSFKPVNCRTLAIPIIENFEKLFPTTFSMKKNERFYMMLHRCFNKSQWKNVVRLLKEANKMAEKLLSAEQGTEQQPSKVKKRKLDMHDKNMLLKKWSEFDETVKKFEKQYSSIENSFIFDFVEGSLVSAVRNGEWLLLDEINLASQDALESISDLLSEPSSRSVLLTEKGQAEPIKAHPNFRIFACMNPATDVGKRDLPMGVRSRFTEIYVHSPDRDITDLLSIIDRYVGKYAANDEWVGNDIAELYLRAKKLSESNQIVDGANQRPHFSIRTLTRALIYVKDIILIYGLRRSLFEAFCMCFLTLLNEKSEALLKPLIEEFILGRLKNAKSVISQIPPCPGPDFIQFKHYWMKRGSEERVEQPHYIITPFVERNMLNLVRATSSKRFPVLIQGPTSAGKTSMIKYLAQITGNKVVRINNHEHTDLQEYLGTYIADETGSLKFAEGALVEALRKGYWIILDELNLAPTDVLEALNRLLDDNRELLIPETQEVVHPHPNFMLFATQNPPGLYGGRKILSRAFRNRFLELHFDDIPQDELEIILKERCQIAPSYAKKIVEVYRQLSVQRSASRLFEQGNSFATLRDLFRWALRDSVGYDELAANGYMLLAERCRSLDEKKVVMSIIEKVMRVKLDMSQYYHQLENTELMGIETSVVWTEAMCRLSVLVEACLKNHEPVLLVGETGCGKTTICQLLAQFRNQGLTTVNAHQNTETGDILGAQRPRRNRSELQVRLSALLVKCIGESLEDIDLNEVSLSKLIELYDGCDKSLVPLEIQSEVTSLRDGLQVLFEWNDGPLVQAMKEGQLFLLDEISLADDSVLERLNSVLEPERTLFLSEKGGQGALVRASTMFEFLATMNPGGDYGKKELSPALRNRFTEIWVPSMENFNDVRKIVSSKLLKSLQFLVEPVVLFSEWFAKKYGHGKADSGIVSLRDILVWVEFLNSSTKTAKEPLAMLLEGAAMVFIDALGTNNTGFLSENSTALANEKHQCVEALSNFASHDLASFLRSDLHLELTSEMLRIGAFDIERKTTNTEIPAFSLSAPTTAKNLMKVVRAMQVKKPILLEGSPGVGKTSLITALAECTGNKLTRINLSEQTDLVDLFGSDVPGERAGEFVWRDAPFLRAMQLGEWVLLDEMNLASQSVLEGLNACFDHRGQAYVPELDKSFLRHENFVVFAAQNPQHQGGGRKGLPKSFVNRFNVVYVEMLTPEDLSLIATHIYPEIETSLISKMIDVVANLEMEVSVRKQWGASGGPWEFNLRDVLRWLKLLNNKSFNNGVNPADFLDLILVQRFRTQADKMKARALIENTFGSCHKRDNYMKLGPDFMQANQEVAERNVLSKKSPRGGVRTKALQCNIPIYESVLRCLKNNWPVILVGPSFSGKTEVIRFLADTFGAHVVEFSMNSDVDSMDLLGGFEQVDLNRALADAVENVKQVITDYSIVNLIAPKSSAHDRGVVACLKLDSLLKSTSISTDNFDEFYQRFNDFKSSTTSEHVNNLAREIENLHLALSNASSVRFKWYDGLLLQAMERGDWMILDNANLCSPSVLDRLNSLLEAGGSMVINECNLEDGSPRVVKPHPDFRLFLTVNPKFGELSRAMRNRGVELFLEDLNIRSTSFDKLAMGFPGNEERKRDVNEKGDKVLSERGSKPLSSLVSQDASLMYELAQVHDILIISQMRACEKIAGVLSLSAIASVNDWLENVSACKLYDEATAIEQISGFVQSANNSDLTPKLSQLLSTSQAKAALTVDLKGLWSHQAIMPLLNFYNLPLLQVEYPFISTAEPVYLFETVCFLRYSFTSLQQTESRALHSQPDKLTYLESSAARHLGRQLKGNFKFPVFDILVKLRTFIEQRMSENRLFVDESFFCSLFKLCAIWINVEKSAIRRNDAKLRAHRDLIQEWKNSSSLDNRSSDDFMGIIELFGRLTEFTRGRSMTLIWEEFRGTYPTSEKSWRKFEKLLDITSKFDQVSVMLYSDSYELIGSLRQFLLDTFKDILLERDMDFEAIMSEIERSIGNLATISSQFLYERYHYFRQEFDVVARLNVAHEKHFLSSTVLEVLPFASISAASIMNSQCKGNFYPPIFDVLWTRDNGCGFISHTSTLFDTTLFGSLVEKLTGLTHIPGCHLSQTKEDGSLLLRYLIRNSEQITVNQMKSFKEELLQIYSRVSKLHAGFPAEKEASSKETSNSAYMLQFYKHVDKLFLKPAIQSAKETESAQSVGKAWIIFSLGMLQLYVPDGAYDPAIFDYVSNECFSIEKGSKESLIESWRFGRLILSGDSPISIENVISKEIKTGIAVKPRIYRPHESIDMLFDEWQAFISSTADSIPVTNMLTSIESADVRALSQANLFQQNTSQFIERLNSSFKVYSDVNDLLSSFINGLKFGTDLVLFGRDKSVERSPKSPLWALNPLVISSTSKICEVFEEAEKFSKNQGLKGSVVEKLMIFFLKLYKLHDKAETLKPVFQKALECLYLRWVVRREQAEKEALNQSGIYRYNHKDEDEESEIAKLFPNCNDEEGSSEDTADEFESASYDLAQSYMQVFSSRSVSITEVAEVGAELTDSLIKNGFSANNVSKNSNDLVSVVHHFVSKLDCLSENQNHIEETLDFYRDHSLGEIRKAIKIVESLWGSVKEFLKQWPDHAILLDLFRVSQEFCHYSLDTPIARSLQKIEQIYTYVTEWQKYASTKVSLQTHVVALTELIVSWRKLELKTWAALFDTEDEGSRKRIGKWWYHLFETLMIARYDTIEGNENSQSLTTLLSSLNVFLSNCTYGEFETRVELLRAFIAHVEIDYGGESALYLALSNFVTFYEQFLPIIRRAKTDARKALEKEMKDIILLASWKDVNVDALKQSSKRSHNSLFKIVRKYREVLNLETKPLIESGIPPQDKPEACFNTLSEDRITGVDLDEAQAILQQLPSWTSRPKTHQSMARTVRNMDRHIYSIVNENLPSFYTFANDVCSEAKRLRDETPKVYDKKDKKKLASLKTQKIRMINDTLKDLRSMGLKLAFRDDIRKVQLSVTSILAHTDCLRDTCIDGCDAYFFRLLDLMPRLKVTLSSPTDDIPPVLLTKGLAASENLMYMLINIRPAMRKSAEISSAIKNLHFELNLVAKSTNALIDTSFKRAVRNAESISEWLPGLIDYAITTVEKCQSYVNCESDLGFLFEAKTWISGLQQDIGGLHYSDERLIKTVFDFMNYMTDLANKLTSCKSIYSFVFEMVASWIKQKLSQDVETLEVKSESANNVGELDRSLQNLTTSIMLTVQKLVEQFGRASEESDTWLTDTQRTISEALYVVQNSRVLSNLRASTDIIIQSNLNKKSSKVVSYMCSYALPLLDSFRRLLTGILNMASKNYENLSHGTFLLANMLLILGSEGLCSPTPPSEEVDDKNLTDGTGLGEGDGAESKGDGLDDEEINEVAQESNEKQKDKEDMDDKGEDSAVEIEGDMGGDLEDASGEDESEGEDKDEDENELDEEVDNIGDDDPNAIDEKMWDNDGSSNSNEKESEQALNNPANEEMKASEEDHDKLNEPHGDEGADEDQESNEAPGEGSEEDDREHDEGGDESEDDAVGQNDEVVDEQTADDMAPPPPEVDTMNLPEGMNLDSEEEPISDNEADIKSVDEMDVDEENSEDHEAEANQISKEEEFNEEESDNLDEEESIEKTEELESSPEADEDNHDIEQFDQEVKNTKDDQTPTGESGGEDSLEGLNGLNNSDVKMEDEDHDTAVQQEAGTRGEGGDALDNEERNDIGSNGAADQSQQMNQDSSANDSSRQEANESLKQLGDNLKEFHRRHNEIREASQSNTEENDQERANQRPDEFEHVEGANTEDTTQALGSANKDQVTSIDEEMAIDDEDLDQEEVEDAEAEFDTNNTGIEQDIEREPEKGPNDGDHRESEKKSSGAYIGERQHISEKDKFTSSDLLGSSDDDLDQLMEEVDRKVKIDHDQLEPARSLEESRALWRNSETQTAELSAGLCEQLRLILEPTLATKLRGDYKTGKRLNMKKIIPYIASQFRKDKIWLRRTKPSKRQYQIMIAVDDSKSMSESKSVNLAFQSICLVSKALTQLESGGLSVVKFGETVQEVHGFNRAFSGDSGPKIFQWFDFQESKTDVKKLVAESIRIFQQAQSSSTADLWQLQIVISDGVCEDHETILRLVRRARENRIMLVFVIVDGINSSQSIMDMSQVSYIPDQSGNLQLKVGKYLDTFPFEFYVVVRDISELPEMLSVILRQYFSELAAA